MSSEIERLRASEASLKARVAALESELAALRQPAVPSTLNRTASNLPIGVAYLDAGQRYLWVNRAYAESFGREPQDFIGHQPDDFILGQRNRIAATARRVYEKAQPESLSGRETCFVDRQGQAHTTYRDVLLAPVTSQNGHVEAMIVLATDVTERVRLEQKHLRQTEALRESERRLAEAQTLARMGSWTWEVGAGTVECSDELLRLYGFPPENHLVPLDALMARIVPEDRTYVRHEVEVADAENRPFSYEHRIRLPDGTERMVVDQGVSLRDAQGRLIRRIGTIQDITERKRAEQELARRTTELEQANEQLQALDRLKSAFVSAVSHELRTPLTSIRGYTEFLEDGIGGPLNAEQATFVHEIERGVKRLLLLVDDLLDFARLEGGAFRLQRVALDISDAIREAVRSLEPQARERDIKLKTVLSPTPLIVPADPGRIAQVLVNLIGNAIKFTPHGGSVSVLLTELEGRVRVDITDTGPGIAREHLPHLFERFYQVDRAYTRTTGGTGLGLSIAKALVEAHGGQIGVESRPGEGATFWFTLPH